MATKDAWAALSASSIIVPANQHREAVFIQKTNDVTVALAIGEAAVATDGIQLTQVGDSVTIRGAAARKAIYAIGNGGEGTYQEGDVTYTPGPTPAPEV
jgi:hypothetical protein